MMSNLLIVNLSPCANCVLFWLLLSSLSYAAQDQLVEMMLTTVDWTGLCELTWQFLTNMVVSSQMTLRWIKFTVKAKKHYCWYVVNFVLLKVNSVFLPVTLFWDELCTIGWFWTWDLSASSSPLIELWDCTTAADSKSWVLTVTFLWFKQSLKLIQTR